LAKQVSITQSRRAAISRSAGLSRIRPAVRRSSGVGAGQRFGPDLDVHAEFADPGAYRLWAQFRLADGTVLTAPFTVRAR
jgi:hypothetical protein